MRGTRFAGPPLLRIVDATSTDTDIVQRVDDFWRLAGTEASGDLWDGPILRLVDASADHVVAGRSTYRYYLAARAGIDVGEPFLALGVTGLLSCHDGLVFGLRGPGTASLAGHWECAPSGSAETQDIIGAVLTELEEEIGIDASLVTEVRHVGMVVDPDENVADYVVAVRIDVSGQQVRERHRTRGSAEYSEIEIVPEEDLPRFLDDHAGNLVPNVAIILALAGDEP